MDEELKYKIAKLCHGLVQLEREFFFGPEDDERWLPTHQIENARAMCPPFVGERYSPGGLAIVGINPGGGTLKTESENYGDSIKYPHIHAFKAETTGFEKAYWQNFNSAFLEAEQSYQMYSQNLRPVLSAASREFDEICYLNVLQYRCLGNKYPGLVKNPEDNRNKIIAKAVKDFLQPFLELVQPSMVNFNGVAAYDYTSKFWEDLPFEYTIWNRNQIQLLRQEDNEKCDQALRNWANN